MIHYFRRKGFTFIEAIIIIAIVALIGFSSMQACGGDDIAGASTMTALGVNGITKATASVTTNAAGLTVEQENVKKRLEEDNQIGALKHLYVISAFSGDVIIYSTVKGKVTSGAKRLSPGSVAAGITSRTTVTSGKFRTFGNSYGGQVTTEVLGDDGTFGSSSPYIYWWDQRDVYHQHFISGGQIVHISNVPMAFPKIILNLEEVTPIAEVTASQ